MMTPSLVDHYRWRVRDLAAEMERDGVPAEVTGLLARALAELSGMREADIGMAISLEAE